MSGCFSGAGAAFAIGFFLLSGTFFPPMWGVAAVVIILVLASAGEEDPGED